MTDTETVALGLSNEFSHFETQSSFQLRCGSGVAYAGGKVGLSGLQSSTCYTALLAYGYSNK